jgi:hypothetical protein
MNRCRSPRAFVACQSYAILVARLVPLVLLLTVLLAPVTADARPTAPAPAGTDAVAMDKKIIDEAKNGSEIMANLTYLSDTIGCRLTGSPALKRANDWAADRMKSYGLTNVHLEGWTIPLGWERGSASLRVIEPEGGKPMTVASAGWSPSTPGKITGELKILNAKTSRDLAPYKGKLRGAIVLQGAPGEMRPVTDTSLFDGKGRRGRFGPGGPKDGKSMDKAKGDDKAKGEVPGHADKGDDKAKGDAAKGGSQGPNPDMMRMFQQMMAFRRELRTFLHDEGAAVLLMDSDKPHGLLNMTGSWPGEDRVTGADPLPSLFVVHEHYGQLYRLATRPGSVPARVEVEITNKLTPGPIAVYNTIGEIRGTEKPDEVVILGAHIDSWDLGQGTTDNGTGTCVVLEAARVLQKCGIKPKRTIRFCLFSGEEEGLYGSRAYVKQHKDELPKMSMCLVHDMGTGKVTGIGLQGRESLLQILQPELASLRELGCTDINLQSMPGSDHQTFDSAGVPGFAVQQDAAEYRFTHHSQSDTLDKAKESELIQGAQVLAVAALRVANLPNLLPHDKPPRRNPWESPSKDDDKAPAKDKAAKQPAATR